VDREVILIYSANDRKN